MVDVVPRQHRARGPSVAGPLRRPRTDLRGGVCEQALPLPPACSGGSTDSSQLLPPETLPRLPRQRRASATSTLGTAGEDDLTDFLRMLSSACDIKRGTPRGGSTPRWGAAAAAGHTGRASSDTLFDHYGRGTTAARVHDGRSSAPAMSGLAQARMLDSIFPGPQAGSSEGGAVSSLLLRNTLLRKAAALNRLQPEEQQRPRRCGEVPAEEGQEEDEEMDLPACPQDGVMGRPLELAKGLSDLRFLAAGAFARVYTGERGCHGPRLT